MQTDQVRNWEDEECYDDDEWEEEPLDELDFDHEDDYGDEGEDGFEYWGDSVDGDLF